MTTHLVSAAGFTGRTAITLGYEAFIRGKHGVFAVQEAVNTVIQLLLSNLTGNINLFSSVITGGTKSLRLATGLLDAGFGKALGKTYLNLLRVINPNARLIKKTDIETRTEFPSAPGFLPAKEMPLFLFSFSKLQQKILDGLNRSSWMINRQITVRIVAPITSALGIVAGGGVFAFGAINAGLSVITLGTRPALNTLAYQSFKAPGWMQNQLRQGTLGIYRPGLLSDKAPKKTHEPAMVKEEIIKAASGPTSSDDVE